MDDDKLSYDDITQQFYKNIVLYEGKPVYVTGVSRETLKVTFTELLTGKRSNAPFSLKTFLPPAVRIGLVNTCGSVVYVVREPKRKMTMGLNSGNLRIKELAVDYPEGIVETFAEIKTLKSADLARAMIGEYPSFEECLEHVKEFKGAMAFDRQFAIDNNRMIFYKTGCVGHLPKNCNRVDTIAFDKPHQHLALLIGDNCGETLRAIAEK